MEDRRAEDPFPRLVSAASVAPWDDTADVVVIGYGISGACAASEARRRGADALILERSSGGTSIISSGIFYLDGGTALQQACDIVDSVEDMYRFLGPKMVRCKAGFGMSKEEETCQ
jgi:flavin-dependent dehydrogenase